MSRVGHYFTDLDDSFLNGHAMLALVFDALEHYQSNHKYGKIARLGYNGTLYILKNNLKRVNHALHDLPQSVIDSAAGEQWDVSQSYKSGLEESMLSEKEDYSITHFVTRNDGGFVTKLVENSGEFKDQLNDLGYATLDYMLANELLVPKEKYHANELDNKIVTEKNKLILLKNHVLSNPELFDAAEGRIRYLMPPSENISPEEGVEIVRLPNSSGLWKSLLWKLGF